MQNHNKNEVFMTLKVKNKYVQEKGTDYTLMGSWKENEVVWFVVFSHQLFSYFKPLMGSSHPAGPNVTGKTKKVPQKISMVRHKNEVLSISFFGVFFPTPPLLISHFYDVIKGLSSSSCFVILHHCLLNLEIFQNKTVGDKLIYYRMMTNKIIPSPD